MPGDEHHALGDELVGDGDRLLRIAGIVADLEHELLAENAAGGVDVGDRLLGAGLQLGAERGVLAGHRAGGRDRDVGARNAGHRQGERQGNAGLQEYFFMR